MSDLLLLSDDFPNNRRGASGESNPISLFGRLSNGKTVGKRAPILISNVKDDTALSPTNLLEVSGPDDAAMPMVLTLSPPKFLKEASISGFPNINPQSVNGFQWVDASSAAFPVVDTAALIEWGTGGVNHSAEVDFGTGAMINLHASYVRVRAKATQIGGGANTGAVYELGAFLSPGEGKSYHPATLTRNFPAGLAIAANTGAMVIPNFARSISMVCQTTSLQIRFWRDFSRTVLVGTYTIFGINPGGQKANIPNGAAVCDFNNATGVATVGGLSVIYELCL